MWPARYTGSGAEAALRYRPQAARNPNRKAPRPHNAGPGALRNGSNTPSAIWRNTNPQS